MSARLLLPTEAAERLGVSTWTLRRWAREGRISAQATVGGHYRYREDVVDTLVQASETTPAVTR